MRIIRNDDAIENATGATDATNAGNATASENSANTETAANDEVSSDEVKEPLPDLEDLGGRSSTILDADVPDPTSLQAAEYFKKLIGGITAIAEKEKAIDFINRVAKTDIKGYFGRLYKEFQSLETEEIRLRTLKTILPPLSAVYHTDKAAPPVFQQHQTVFINGVNVNVDQLKDDPTFWWQPITNVKLFAATKPLSDLLRDYNPKVDDFNLGTYQTNIRK